MGQCIGALRNHSHSPPHSSNLDLATFYVGEVTPPSSRNLEPITPPPSPVTPIRHRPYYANVRCSLVNSSSDTSDNSEEIFGLLTGSGSLHNSLLSFGWIPRLESGFLFLHDIGLELRIQNNSHFTPSNRIHISNFHPLCLLCDYKPDSASITHPLCTKAHLTSLYYPGGYLYIGDSSDSESESFDNSLTYETK